MAGRAWRSIGLVVAFVCAALVGGATAPAAGAPAGDAGIGCGWSPRLGADTVQFAFPDSFANYWVTTVPALPGMSLTLHGQYPHARYMSFTSYGGSAPGAAYDGLNDARIAPAAGSSNPFLVGADRTAAQRDYAIRVVGNPRPDAPAANTLYTTGRLLTVVYRVYRADRGLDPAGGTELPRITVNLPDRSYDLPACGRSSSPVDPTAVAAPLGLSLSRDADGPSAQWTKASGAGLFPNPDNNYIAAPVSLPPGRVAVIRAQLPMTPATYDGQPRMGDGELRYWSLCANELVTTRVVACAADDQIPLDGSGSFTVVVSAPGDRPGNGEPRCGATWLPAAGRTTVMIMRNMLPAADFAQSIHTVPAGDEAAGMGAFYPATSIVSKAEFEARGCAS